MQIKQRNFELRIKSLSEDGTFASLLSPYGNVDDDGDLVEPGAFTKSLGTYGHIVPMLWQHKMDCPIGDLTLTDQPDGLYCEGRFLLEIAEAQKAYALLKAGIIKGLSIGYETVKAATINGVRHLKELRLYEGSVVTFPMNGLAQVNSVKTQEQEDDSVAVPTDTNRAQDVPEVKVGKRLSASTRDTLTTAHEHMKSAADVLATLLETELDDESAGAEPDEDTELKAAKFITSMRSLLSSGL